MMFYFKYLHQEVGFLKYNNNQLEAFDFASKLRLNLSDSVFLYYYYYKKKERII